VPDPGELERRTTQLLVRLIQFDTVNPPGAEEQCQRYLRELLEAAGFEVDLLAAVPGRPNLVARLAAPSGADGPTLCLLGHVDTVLANPAEWEVGPWSGALRDDGCVWGRGALDMKSQVAAEVAAACMLAEAGWRPEAGELKLVITADEETGATYGAQWLCSEHAGEVRADLIVNEGAGASFEYPPDGGSPRRVYPVCVAEKGVFRFSLTAHGRAGHASLPRIGDNALTKLAPLLSALGAASVVPEHSPEPDAFLTALGIGLDDLDAALAEVEATDPRVAVLLEPLLGITFAPTMAAASEKINVIPSAASVRVDCRVPPGLGEAHVRQRVHDALGWDSPPAGAPAGFSLDFEETVTGNRSPIDTPLMETIRAFVAQEDPGAVITATALAGFSDSHWFRAAFPDCVAYGFFPQRRMDLFEAMPLVHGANERIPVEDLGLAARFYARLVETTLR
jgi:acetylornithine deacetylase/succinyl-diaminopimelate desuccinylase-like protein